MGPALKIGDRVRMIGITASTTPPGYKRGHPDGRTIHATTNDSVFKAGTYVHGVVFEGHPKRLYVPPEWLEKIDPDRDSCGLNLEQLLDSVRREVISDPKIKIERNEPA